MDIHIKQFLGLVLGIVSIIFPYASFFSMFSRTSRSSGFFIGLAVGAVIGIIGLIISIVSIKQANLEGESKGKAIAGLVTSIVGILTCAGMGLVFGGTILLAANLK